MSCSRFSLLGKMHNARQSARKRKKTGKTRRVLLFPHRPIPDTGLNNVFKPAQIYHYGLRSSPEMINVENIRWPFPHLAVETVYFQSTVRKKMAAVHFTTIFQEPKKAISTDTQPYFGKIHPCTKNIVYARFEVFIPILCVFMSGFRIFVR